ncbi:MAG: hypothetical protein QOE61_4906, partial [Micromonosporaceae bacterium]|nr:hypothetical protein [Micromonosporaceae bacterium]
MARPGRKPTSGDVFYFRGADGGCGRGRDVTPAGQAVESELKI